MASVFGVHLLPSTGEFSYDTVPYWGRRITEPAPSNINTYFAPGGAKTDYSFALDQLQAAHPECTTVSLVVAWFGNSTDASQCQIYPTTTYINGTFGKLGGGSDVWRCSGLTQNSPGLIPIPSTNGKFIYGGTPSDQSIVRCIQDLKARGFRVVFYPFLLMTASGSPWRGRITYSNDATSAAANAVNTFLGSASPAQYTPDAVNLTVAYSGSPTDFTYRRMILHYAWLMTVAGGIDLFMIGSELRGLETIRGPGWSKAGTTDGLGNAIWDYPFVAGLVQLAADVRSVLNSQSYSKNTTTLKNLISYTADWSSWMGWQHAGQNGQWPHLDQLWASANIDLVGFDDYLPLSDWTTGSGGLDALNWRTPPPSGAWPPTFATMSGLGLSGPPTITSKPYLKANIEGGEKFNWYYNDSNNLGLGFDPNGSDLRISRPEADRLTQTRNPYYAQQQILANKQFRWWWKNLHTAVYDAGDGHGWIPHGPQTQWQARSKSLAFIEYGFPAVDKGTNQPNVFFAPSSVESFTPFWSIWDPASNSSSQAPGFTPRRDDTLSLLALQAIYEYWTSDGRNEMSSAGLPLIQTAFCSAWNWDARPFPIFPIQNAVWGDTGNWPSGNWIGGRGPATPPVPAPTPPGSGVYPSFPSLVTLGWSTHMRPIFSTDIAMKISGRSSRRPRFAAAFYEMELIYDILRSDALNLELQTIAGFFEANQGQGLPFWLAPPALSAVGGQAIGVGDGTTTTFPLVRGVGAYSEPAQGTSGVSAVYFNGVIQAAGWSLTSNYAPAVVFASAPPTGVVITVDFGLLMLCRFAEDVADFENFMTTLWSFRTVKLRTVRP